MVSDVITTHANSLGYFPSGSFCVRSPNAGKNTLSDFDGNLYSLSIALNRIEFHHNKKCTTVQKHLDKCISHTFS